MSVCSGPTFVKPLADNTRSVARLLATAAEPGDYSSYASRRSEFATATIVLPSWSKTAVPMPAQPPSVVTTNGAITAIGIAEVLLDDARGLRRQLHRERQRAKIAAHQRDVGCLQGDPRAACPWRCQLSPAPFSMTRGRRPISRSRTSTSRASGRDRPPTSAMCRGRCDGTLVAASNK